MKDAVVDVEDVVEDVADAELVDVDPARIACRTLGIGMLATFSFVGFEQAG